jgi:hypothetical protein
VLRSKWSSEEEKNKLENRGRKMQELKRGGRSIPRGNRPLLLGKRHSNLLHLHFLNRFRLRPNPTLSAGTCARGRSLIQGAASSTSSSGIAGDGIVGKT